MTSVQWLSRWHQFFCRGWDPEQTGTRNLLPFNPEQELFLCGPRQARMEHQHHPQQENRAFSFFKKILTKIWAWFWTYGAKSSNFLWLRFQCYGGPILTQKYVNSSWLFLQHWCWQTSKSRTFCLCSSWLFEVDDSLCVTSSCFPPFPPRGPPTWEDRQGREGYGTPAAGELVSFVNVCCLLSSSRPLFPTPGRSLPSSGPCKAFAPSRQQFICLHFIHLFTYQCLSPGRVGPLQQVWFQYPRSSGQSLAQTRFTNMCWEGRIDGWMDELSQEPSMKEF